MQQETTLLTCFERMRKAARGQPEVPAKLRQQRLRALERLLRDNAAALIEAVSQDFGHRSPSETRLLELFPCYAAIDHALRRVHCWMRPRRVGVDLWFQPASAEVRSQPLGVVGVMVPWNYPLFLAVAPLVGALAAGNRVMLKLSEYSPATSALLSRLVAREFAEDVVMVVEGDVAVGQAFAALPFDHLLFTGATSVGREVMRAAAANLTPVTLELGGKSPAIIGPHADFSHAVERIVVGKLLNAGQTCVAPDYVLLPAGLEDAFLAEARRVVAACYPQLATTPDYTHIVSERHFSRLCGLLEAARNAGAEVGELAPGIPSDPVTRRLPPFVVRGANDALRLMQDEIFGPILPLVPYDPAQGVAAAIDYVNARPRPLALYIFERDKHSIERVLGCTVSGGVTVNDTLLHVAQERLPFGGVGPSGMGRYHGYAGFSAFSAQKSVFRQSRFSGIGLFKPPYGVLFKRLMRLLLR